jgi:hypothetical protein
LVEFCLFCEFVKFNGDIQILFGREKSSFSLLSHSEPLLYGVLLIIRWSVLTCGQFGPRLVVSVKLLFPVFFLGFQFLGAIYLFDWKGNKANAEDESRGIGVGRGAGCGGSAIMEVLPGPRSGSEKWT